MLLFYTELIACLIFTIYLYFKYAEKKISPWIGILVIGTWFLNFLPAVLVPFDLLLSLKTPIENVPVNYIEQRKFYDYLYALDYWVIYLLSWVIIPVAQEYVVSTELTRKNKLKKAIKTNLLFYLIFAFAGIIFVVYLIYNQQLTGKHLQGFLISLSNAWGLFLIIFLLGYGLVAIPKEFFRKSDYENRLKYLEWSAGRCQQNINRNEDEQHEIQRKILEIKNNFDFDLEAINSAKNLMEKLQMEETILEEEAEMFKDNPSTEKLIKLIHDKIYYLSEIKRLNIELTDIFEEWYYLSNLIKKTNSNHNNRFQPAAIASNVNSKSEPSDDLSYYDSYYLNYRPCILKAIGVVSAVFSLAIILSEITLFLDMPLSVFSYFLERCNSILTMNITVLLPLIFLFLTSLYGLFKIKIYGIYHVSKSQNTDASSLLFLTSFICKIGYPLCLNFVYILKMRTYRTSLETLLGVMDLFPVFGNNFALFYPTILILFILFNVFDVFGKLSNFMGFSAYGFKTEENDEIFEDGLQKLNNLKFHFEREKMSKNDYGYEEFKNYAKRDTYLGTEITDINN